MDNALHILQTSREIYSRIRGRIHALAYEEAVAKGGYSQFYNKYDPLVFVQQRDFLELIELEIAKLSDGICYGLPSQEQLIHALQWQK